MNLFRVWLDRISGAWQGRGTAACAQDDERSGWTASEWARLANGGDAPAVAFDMS